MGNWNRHFVRVGSDGNMGVFDQKGNRFIKETISSSDNLPQSITIIPSSLTERQITIPTENNAIEFSGNLNGFSYIVPNSAIVLDLGSTAPGYLQNDFNQGINLFDNTAIPNKFTTYKSLPVALNTFATIAGSPDLRIGVTAADASPITIFSSTASGVRYEVKARILATAGTSATYTISWTEGGAVRTVALTVTATGTEVHDNFVVAPDANTNITAQITSLTSSTVNVDAIVSVLG